MTAVLFYAKNDSPADWEAGLSEFIPNLDFRVFTRSFINFCIMGWILIDFALLNIFANCDFYRFFEMLTFS